MTGRFAQLHQSNPPKRKTAPSEDGLPPHPVFDRKVKHQATKQHLVYDLDSGRPEQGNQINEQYHLSSNTKLAALAFIAKVGGPEYIQRNKNALKEMMSVSHNDATIVQVAKVMGHPDAERFRQIAGNGIQRRASGAQINLLANKLPEDTRKFFDLYRTALMEHAKDFGIQGARISDTSGRAEPGLHRGTSEGSPMHIAGVVKYLYNLDKGKTLSELANPTNAGHTTASYLKGRDKPGNGQVFFAKTGSIAKSEYGALPKDSPVREQFPNGVYLLTIGYMHEGKPKMVMFRAESSERRKELANKFLDDVAGIRPAQKAEVKRPPRPTQSA